MQKNIYIAVIIIVAVGLVQFVPRIFLPNKPQSLEKVLPEQVRIDMDDANIKINAISFYAEYDKCLKEPSQTSQSCLKKNTFISSKFAKAEQSLSQDPVFCSDNSPFGYSINDIKINKDTGEVGVIESFAYSKQKIILNFEKSNNIWKVQKVNCPHI